MKIVRCSECNTELEVPHGTKIFRCPICRADTFLHVTKLNEKVYEAIYVHNAENENIVRVYKYANTAASENA